jgi:hypothetical protein
MYPVLSTLTCTVLVILLQVPLSDARRVNVSKPKKKNFTFLKSLLNNEAIQIGSAVIDKEDFIYYEVLDIGDDDVILCHAAAGDAASRKQFLRSELIHVRAGTQHNIYKFANSFL